MDPTAPSRVRAARMRTILRLGALLVAVVSLAAIAGPASASHRSRHSQRAAARQAAARAFGARRHTVAREHRFVLVARRARADAVRRARRHSRHHARRHAHRGCRGAHAQLGRARRARIRHAVVCLLNAERARHGLPALQGSRRLNDSAQNWTNAMVSHRDFSHGSDFAARITAVGFDWSRVGENIATGFHTPAAAVRAWMRSAGHCQNILNPMFREAGTGVAAGTTGIGHGTWTLDFGLLMAQHAASTNFTPAAGCPYSG